MDAEKSAREQWALRDIVPMILDHYEIASASKST